MHLCDKMTLDLKGNAWPARRMRMGLGLKPNALRAIRES